MNQQLQEGIVKFGTYRRRKADKTWTFRYDDKDLPVFRVPSDMKPNTPGYAMAFEEYATYLPNAVEYNDPPDEKHITGMGIGTFLPNQANIMRAYRWSLEVDEFVPGLFRAIHCRRYRIFFEREITGRKNLVCRFETEFLMAIKSGEHSLLERIRKAILNIHHLHAKLVHYDGMGKKIEDSIIALAVRSAEIVGDYGSNDVLSLKMQCDVIAMNGLSIEIPSPSPAPQTPVQATKNVKKAMKPPVKTSRRRARTK